MNKSLLSIPLRWSVLMLACVGALAPLAGCTPPPPTIYPAYNDVFGVATHNSYYMNATDNYDFGASGTQEVISDQLLHEHTAALELDIHSEGAPPKTWKVYHTSDAEDFTCNPLAECLKMLQNFQYTVPDHDVVTVMLELKNTAPVDAYITQKPVTPNFDANHTIEDLDNLLRAYLGAHLYTPKDLLQTCHNVEGTLVECMTQRGGKWPTMDQLRGKFIFTLFGNWGSNYYDWAKYATQDLIYKRVAFPMMMFYDIHANPDEGQVWHLLGLQPPEEPIFTPRDVDAQVYGKFVKDYNQDNHLWPVWIPQDVHQRAVAQSIFWQFEPTEDPDAMDLAQQFIKEKGIIRVGGPDKDPNAPNFHESPGYQLALISKKFQFIQTDHPWAFAADGGPTGTGIPVDPSHRWRQRDWPLVLDATYDKYREYGEKLYFSVQAGSLGTAWRDEPANGPYSGFWLETTVSTTRVDGTWVRDEYPTPNYHDETQFPRRAQDDPNTTPQGCVQVVSPQGQQTFQICREMNHIPHFWDDASQIGYRNPERLQWQERGSVSVQLWTGGKQVFNHVWWLSRSETCGDPAARSDSYTPDCLGNMIAIQVQNTPIAGGKIQSVATAMSANSMASSGMPGWHMLDQVKSASGTWSQVGLRANEDVLFAGARIAQFDGQQCHAQGPEQWLRLSDLPHQVVSPGRMHIADLTRGALPTTSPGYPCAAISQLG